jgi:large subunit ribosomal protein L17
MRHGNNKRKFGRKKSVRNALMSSLARNLIVRGKIKTTEEKAKELRPYVEKIVTLGKKNNVATRRLVAARLDGRTPETKKVFDVIAPKYADRKGGYTRVIKMGPRKSDGAKLAFIEFV